MNILLTNDDGYFSSGIQSLFNYLSLNHHVLIVAPDRPRSTSGHTLSLKKPVRIKKINTNIYSCSGFPADCVLYALEDFSPRKFDLVISGINNVSNLGQDIFYSGTVAGAREAFFRGVPSIALSLASDLSDNKELYYESCVNFLDSFLRNDFESFYKEDSYLNINIPNYPYREILGVERCSLGFLNYLASVKTKSIAKDEKLCWVGGPLGETSHSFSSDFNAIRNKKVSITSLKYFDQVADREVK